MWPATSDEQARHEPRTTTSTATTSTATSSTATTEEHTMYGDPLFVNAELAYRRQLFAAGTGHVGSSRRHGHSWAERLHLRLPHRHTTQVRPA